MVVLNRIYTRTGDTGTTALAAGGRRPKYDLRIEAYGTVDETNACLGLVRLHTSGDPLDAVLSRIQNDLFDLGSDLATVETGKPLPYAPLRITQGQVDRLEHEIDDMNAHLSTLRSFVLPGGTAAAAALHLARTVCRRAERRAVDCGEELNPECVRYLNRLSDLLFILARAANDGDEPLWEPGRYRG